jgi:hypothetical protein
VEVLSGSAQEAGEAAEGRRLTGGRQMGEEVYAVAAFVIYELNRELYKELSEAMMPF